MRLVIRNILYIISLSVLVSMGVYLTINMVLFAYMRLFEPIKIESTEVIPISNQSLIIDVCGLNNSGAVVATTDTNCKEY